MQPEAGLLAQKLRKQPEEGLGADYADDNGDGQQDQVVNNRLGHPAACSRQGGPVSERTGRPRWAHATLTAARETAVACDLVGQRIVGANLGRNRHAAGLGDRRWVVKSVAASPKRAAVPSDHS